MRAREEGGERKKPSIDISKNDIKKEVEVVKSKIQDKIKQMPTEKKKQIIIAAARRYFISVSIIEFPRDRKDHCRGA